MPGLAACPPRPDLEAIGPGAGQRDAGFRGGNADTVGKTLAAWLAAGSPRSGWVAGRILPLAPEEVLLAGCGCCDPTEPCLHPIKPGQLTRRAQGALILHPSAARLRGHGNMMGGVCI